MLLLAASSGGAQNSEGAPVKRVEEQRCIDSWLADLRAAAAERRLARTARDYASALYCRRYNTLGDAAYVAANEALTGVIESLVRAGDTAALAALRNAFEAMDGSRASQFDAAAVPAMFMVAAVRYRAGDHAGALGDLDFIVRFFRRRLGANATALARTITDWADRLQARGDHDVAQALRARVPAGPSR